MPGGGACIIRGFGPQDPVCPMSDATSPMERAADAEPAEPKDLVPHGTVIRSAISMTSLKSCSTSKTVIPCSRMRRINCSSTAVSG